MTAKGLKKSSIEKYFYILKKFFEETNTTYIEVTAQTIINYLAYKKLTKNSKGKYSTPNYIASICKNISLFFKWAYKKKYINEDITREIDRPKTVLRKKDRLFDDEVEKCREMLKDSRERALFELMLCSGPRVGELEILKIEDVDLKRRIIHIPGYKTESSDRDGFLSLKAVDALKEYIGDRTSGWLFLPKSNIRENALSRNAIEQISREIAKRANCHCKATVHIYRKTFATQLYKKTKDIKLVSRLLGHTDIRTTVRYYITDDDVESMADIMLNLDE